MKEKILQLLENKVDEIFLEMQNEFNIQDGNIFPLDALELDNCMENLANKIEHVLNTQK